MNRIDRIISESINRFILREVDEARTRRDPWAGLEQVKTRVIKPSGDAINVPDANTSRGKKIVDDAIGRPEKPHKKRVVARTIFDASPNNASQIRRTLRASWQPKLKPMYGLLGKFTNQYGVSNAQNLLKLFNEVDQTGKKVIGLTTQYNILFEKLNEYTTEIEGYGSDLNHIKKKLSEMPKMINDITNIIYALCKRCQKIKQLLNSKSVDLGFNKNVIYGYVTSSGLEKKPIYKSLNSEEMKNLTGYLSKVAEQLDYLANEGNDPIDMNHNEFGITTVRR